MAIGSHSVMCSGKVKASILLAGVASVLEYRKELKLAPQWPLLLENLYRFHNSSKLSNHDMDGRTMETSILVDFPKSQLERETEGGRSLLPPHYIFGREMACLSFFHVVYHPD